ncbi:uncharacterized protein IUM83_04581 [Phytophthora cinnamomi]|uniref:uncharacterized protein n=1 Tax=Phytophthora cinnamomi TaxID=4785 RepID=UPI00355A94A9|nr:hypothetical protein IUM83_04581 [Phytophthora cinnamomi]
MPLALLWTELAVGLSKDEADLLLESFKAFKITKSSKVQCNVCTEAGHHNMRMRELRCACRQCKAAEPYARCLWRGKMLKCERHDLVHLFKVGSHVTARHTPPPARLTRAMKEFAHQMADQGLKPARIRTGLMRKFELRTEVLPPLKTVQRLHQECDAFTFTWRTDMEGIPYVGNGADSNPFLVGVTSKALIRQADRDSASFVLHIDATFKLNQVDYPVFVVGISDRRRAFHLLAIFVSSQRQEMHFAEALMDLWRIYTQVTGKQLAVRYAMGDADDAQHNAV